jgi:hypothetical protein
VGGQPHAPAALPPGKTILLESGWAPKPVWTGAENLDPYRDISSNKDIFNVWYQISSDKYIFSKFDAKFLQVSIYFQNFVSSFFK